MTATKTGTYEGFRQEPVRNPGLERAPPDPGLDAVLSEIELRVEVELAKAGRF